MWPPIEAGSPKLFFGLPAIIWWGILTGCLIILILTLASIFLYCWLLPSRRQKILSPAHASTITTPSTNTVAAAFPNLTSSTDIDNMTHQSSMATKSWTNSTNHMSLAFKSIVPPQYSAPPPPPTLNSSSMYQHHHYHQYMLNYLHYPSSSSCGMDSNTTSVDDDSSLHNMPETHKSMWTINPLCASNSALSGCESGYRTRSLPAWGKAVRQRPISTTDDIEELYAKVNLSKKRRNRMRNGEAAIIALCRSRSQNLSGLPLEREGVVIYDERTAL